MPYCKKNEPPRLCFLWAPGDLKARVVAAAKQESVRVGYPVSVSDFIRRTLEDVLRNMRKK